MNESVNQNMGDVGELSIEDVVQALLACWHLIFMVPIVVAALTYGATFLMTPKYQATLLLTPSREMQTLAGNGEGISNALSGLSGLAGLGIGPLGQEDTGIYLAELTSRSLLLEFADTYNLKAELFPERMHDEDPDSEAGVVKRGRESTREKWEVYEALVGAIDAEVDRKSGTITVKLLWKTPDEAARLSNALVSLLNQRVKDRALAQAEENLAYLEKRLAQRGSAVLVEATSRLMGIQLRQHMLANGVDDFAFTVIDPAIPPARAARPRRAVISGLAFVVTGALTATVVLFRARRRKTRQSAAL